MEALALEVWGGLVDDAGLRRLVGGACSKGPRRSSKEVLEGVGHLLAELAVTSASSSDGSSSSK